MSHNHGGPDDMEMTCPMQMSFHGGSCEVILFPSWATTEAGAFVGATIGFFLLAFAYEGLKYGRELLHYSDASKRGTVVNDKRTLRNVTHGTPAWYEPLVGHCVDEVKNV